MIAIIKTLKNRKKKLKEVFNINYTVKNTCINYVLVTRRQPLKRFDVANRFDKMPEKSPVIPHLKKIIFWRAP